MIARIRIPYLAAGIAGALALAASSALANTITVENLSQDKATGTYQYSITLDSEAYVNPGDGFVIYDFPGLTSWSITGTGGSGSLASSGTGTTSTGPIRLVESATSNGLTDANASTIADLDATTVALDNGLSLDSTVENLSFVYSGPPSIYTGAASATLTIDTSSTTVPGVSVYASVDRSGTIPGTSYGTAEGTVLVPGGLSVPEPASAGIMLIVGGAMTLRRRRRA
ncbi:MAG TPA: PEP-CTERM sorting domain-containing protein [Tepidisphaeraceae bacterium]|nr:PEP-CTERM sorting domain-containing protein [Tepidisphaeraceae bacterium]